jgi:hypothetical protein
MTELKTVYFRSASGVHEVKLPATEALLAVRRHSYEWPLTPDTFTEAPEGWVPSEGNGGDRGNVQAQGSARTPDRARGNKCRT